MKEQYLPSPRIQSFISNLTPWTGLEKFSLLGMARILEKLDNPQDSVPAIHVTGTNGKGSTTVLCAAALASAGHKVGALMSPHVLTPNERILVNGYPVESGIVESAVDILTRALSSLNITMSVFEFWVAAGYLVARECALEYLVVETGLGGRLDATNLSASPVVTAITNIAFDHVDHLGGTERAIWYEKNRIYRKGVPLVLGSLSPALPDLIRASPYFCSDDIVVSRPKACFEGCEFVQELSVTDEGRSVLGLVESIIDRTGIQLPDLSRLRCQPLGRVVAKDGFNAPVLIDAAHNPAGVRYLKNYLKARAFLPCTVFLGLLRKELWAESAGLLAGESDISVILVVLDDPRAPDYDELRAIGVGEVVSEAEFCTLVRTCSRPAVVTGSHRIVSAAYTALEPVDTYPVWT